MRPVLELKRELDEKRVTASIIGIFNDPRWRPIPQHLSKAHRFFPNVIYYNIPERLLAVVAHRSSLRQHFGLTEKALQYAVDSQTQGKVRQAYVTLLEKGGNQLLAYELALTVKEKVASTPLFPGIYGSHWWIDLKFDPAQDGLPF
jgi:hypothetical protein